MDTAATPQNTEITKRVADLVPLLRKNALWAEQNRRMSDETVEAMTDAGVFRMRVAARYGGYECDAATLLDVGIELGRGDGAAAFNTAAWWITSWNVGLFADEVQDEVFASPDNRVCGTLSIGGTAVPKKGGIVVNGEWAFNSGAAHSQWKLLSTILIAPDREPEPIMAVVPVSSLKIVDDWHVSALSGTGSVTTVAEDLFVPDIRTMRIMDLTAGNFATRLNTELPMFRTPLVGSVAASTSGKMIGMAKAAHEYFFDRIGKRPISVTDYARQADAPLTHLQAAEATLKLDEAELLARKAAAMIDGKARANEEWTMLERAYARAVGGRVPQLSAEVVELMAGACGASSIYTKEPIQRLRRDTKAVTIHALHNPTTTMELYGRLLCGLEPNTFFI